MRPMRLAILVVCGIALHAQERVSVRILLGVTDKVNTITDYLASLPPIVILRLRNMTAIDAAGIAALEELADQLQKSGRSMLSAGHVCNRKR